MQGAKKRYVIPAKAGISCMHWIPAFAGMTIILLALVFSIHAAELPAPTGHINDLAHVIHPETATQLTNIITQFERATGDELAVVTVPSLEGEPIENYAVALFEKWGVGKKREDNGILFVVAPNEEPNERDAHIEVGYGLEPYINDALAGRIIRDTMLPHFKTGDFSQGILNGVVEAVSVIAKKTGVQFDPVAAGQIDASNLYHLSERQTAPDSIVVKILKIIAVIFIILFFIKNPWAALFMLSSFSGGGGRGGSFRGGFGGGFSGFGGGRSGGGGASGSW